jgi:hypothetical protein
MKSRLISRSAPRDGRGRGDKQFRRDGWARAVGRAADFWAVIVAVVMLVGLVGFASSSRWTRCASGGAFSAVKTKRPAAQ